MVNNLKKTIIFYKISLAETDSVGIVYFANYLIFFEKGHQDFLYQAGIDISKLIKQGIFMPITETKCNYLKPLFYGDLIEIQTSIIYLNKTSLKFNYSIVNSANLIANGYTSHIFTNNEFKPIRIPAEIKKILMNC